MDYTFNSFRGENYLIRHLEKVIFFICIDYNKINLPGLLLESLELLTATLEFLLLRLSILFSLVNLLDLDLDRLFFSLL